jgi:uncharacterized protein YeaO (DUF488 family)
MPLQFQTVQLGSPRKKGEGVRIGAVRYLPRGVRKADYAKRDFFDVWLPSLAPSRTLLAEHKKSRMTPAAFFRHYRAEMAETEPRQTIALLATLARHTPISIGCYCDDESQCHRSVLGELIRKAASN